jgi:DNA-binding NarL/FixJ family response regulator
VTTLDTPTQRAARRPITGYRVQVTTDADEAAATEAAVRARNAIKSLDETLETVELLREERDRAIYDMLAAGRSAPEIHRELNLPLSTVRNSIRMALVRAATPIPSS